MPQKSLSFHSLFFSIILCGSFFVSTFTGAPVSSRQISSTLSFDRIVPVSHGIVVSSKKIAEHSTRARVRYIGGDCGHLSSSSILLGGTAALYARIALLASRGGIYRSPSFCFKLRGPPGPCAMTHSIALALV